MGLMMVEISCRGGIGDERRMKWRWQGGRGLGVEEMFAKLFSLRGKALKAHDKYLYHYYYQVRDTPQPQEQQIPSV